MIKKNLRDIVAGIDFKVNIRRQPNWTPICEAFGIGMTDWSYDTRLTYCYIQASLCTDTHVGVRAYFLDDEFVALSIQPYRKADEEFEFVSQEAADKVEQYLRSLFPSPKPSVNIIKDWDVSLYYTLDSTWQILPQYHTHGLLDGKTPVTIVEKCGSWNNYGEDTEYVIVEGEDKRKKRVKLSDIQMLVGAYYQNARQIPYNGTSSKI